MEETEKLYVPTKEDLLKYESDERGGGLSQKCLLREVLMPYRQGNNTEEWIRWVGSEMQGKPILAFETRGLMAYDSYLSKRSKAKIYLENVNELDSWKGSLLAPFQKSWKRYKKNYYNVT